MGDRRLAQMEHCADVGVDRAVPLFIRDLLQRLVGHLEGSVTHQDVNAAKLIDGRLNDVPAVLRICHVALDQYGASTCLLNIALSVLGVGVLTEVRDQHVGTFSRVRDGDGSAYPGVATGDHRDLVGQLSTALITFLAAVRYRRYLRLSARHFLFLCRLAHASSLTIRVVLAGYP